MRLSREPDRSAPAARQWCRDTLPRVSRTFALNIRVLPGELRDAVSIAYLLCRIADSLEDARHVGWEPRARGLEAYRRMLRSSGVNVAEVEDWVRRALPLVRDRVEEARLIRGTPTVLRALQSLPATWRRSIEACVLEMAAGMADFVRPAATGPRIASWPDLVAYCHVVAGVVGSMLCSLFEGHTRRLHGERSVRLREHAEAFARGLQLTNILQDLGNDQERGRCYVPACYLEAAGLDVAHLTHPGWREPARRCLTPLVEGAYAGLRAALRFTQLLPRSEVRLRLFCLWPWSLALRTLAVVLRDPHWPRRGSRPRLSRAALRGCLGAASLHVWTNRGLARWFTVEAQPLCDFLEAAPVPWRESGVRWRDVPTRSPAPLLQDAVDSSLISGH